MTISLRRQLMLAALALLLTACAKRATQPAAVIPLAPLAIEQRIFRDDAGGIQSKTERVIRDSVAWREVWQAVTSRQSSPTPIQAINFQQNMLILVAAGRLTIADAISVDSVASKSERTESGTQDVVWVWYSITRDCPRPSTDAFPLEIVRVRRSTAQVRFDEKIKPGPNCR